MLHLIKQQLQIYKIISALSLLVMIINFCSKNIHNLHNRLEFIGVGGVNFPQNSLKPTLTATNKVCGTIKYTWKTDNLLF